MLAALLWLALSPDAVLAQEAAQAASEPPAAATPAPAESAADDPAEAQFTSEELRKLLAPFALYPDALLAQLLPACAYPIDIVQASRWLDKNEAAVKKGDFSGADGQAWDPSVRALVRFPDVIAKLNDDLDRTTDLGDAFVNQPEDVAATIQTLRAEAQKGGSLKSTKEQRVVVQTQNAAEYIVIEPADPEVIYVPAYDPATVYYEDDYDGAWVAGAVGFGVGVAVGAAVDNVWDWNRGWVYPPRWPGYPGYRPGYPGRNVNIGNDVTIGGNNDINIGNGNTRPWKPDQDHYRPGQGSKPALADKAGQRRPGGKEAVKRPGAAAAGVKGGSDAIAARPGGGKAAALEGGVKRPAAAGKQPVKAKQATKAKQAVAKGPSQSPGKGAKSVAAKKSAQAAAKKPKPTAFSNVRQGGGSPAMSQRGASSRNAYKPAGGGASIKRGGGGGRAGGHGGGRGGGRR